MLLDNHQEYLKDRWFFTIYNDLNFIKDVQINDLSFFKEYWYIWEFVLWSSIDLKINNWEQNHLMISDYSQIYDPSLCKFYNSRLIENYSNYFNQKIISTDLRWSIDQWSMNQWDIDQWSVMIEIFLQFITPSNLT